MIMHNSFYTYRNLLGRREKKLEYIQCSADSNQRQRVLKAEKEDEEEKKSIYKLHTAHHYAHIQTRNCANNL